MKQFAIFFLAAAALAGHAQTPSKPAAPKAAAKATTAKPAASLTAVKLPPGVPPVHRAVQTAFSLRYQDIVIGTGKDAEPNKIYKVQYTGWLAADGHKFDSSYDRKTPVIGKDGKPELDADGKPKMNEGQPITFPQGFGRVIPGFDQGFIGMKIGGKRRLFIPWQLAYGARGRPGPNAENPGIPPKADLIFDIELVDVTDMPMPQARPMPPHFGAPGTPGAPAVPASQSAPSKPTTPAPASQANPASTPPAGTPPPATRPAEKPQSTPDKPQSK